MKKNILTVSIGLSLLLVVFVATGFVLCKTGKIKFGADTNGLQTYTVSGRSFDPLANAPMAGQKITVFSDAAGPIQTQTDANGYYNTKIQASADGIINVTQGDGGTEGDTCTFVADAGNLYRACNFNLGKPPFDEDVLFQDINTIQAAGDSAPAEPDLSRFDPVIIDGVNYKPFVTIKDPHYKPDLSGFKDAIAFNAKWLQTLKSTTGVTDDFPIILVPEIDWQKDATGSGNAGGYMNLSWKDGKPWHCWMVLDVNKIIPSLISHEFGHYVDWVKGWDFNGLHAFSSNDRYYKEAFMRTTRDKAITGYGTANEREMFAEFFASLLEPMGNDPTQVDLTMSGPQRSFRFSLRYYLLFTQSPQLDHLGCHVIEYLNVDCSGDSYLSVDNLSPVQRIPTQNSLMYLYKFVAKAAGQIEYFPGNVYNNSQFVDISSLKKAIDDGNYMDGKGVVTVVVRDHKGKVIDDFLSDIALAGADQGNLSGPFVVTGYTFMPVSTGDQELTFSDLPDDYPIPFLGQMVDIKNGSNYVPINYREFMTQYLVRPETYPWGTFSAEFAEYPPYAFWGEFETKNGTKFTGLRQKTIPRYPNEGTGFGFGQFDKKFTDEAPNNKNFDGTYKILYYKINYVIGGGDEFIFPMKARLKGPMGAVPPEALATVPVRTETRQLIQNGVLNAVEGVFGKKCFHKETLFGAWPWCETSLPW